MKRTETLEQKKRETALAVSNLFSYFIPVLSLLIYYICKKPAAEFLVSVSLLVFLFLGMVYFTTCNNVKKASFYNCLLLSYGICTLCVFLPSLGWPFCVVYLLFALFCTAEEAILLPGLMLVFLGFINGKDNTLWLGYLFLGLITVYVFNQWKTEKNTAHSMIVFVCSFILCQCIFVVLNHGLRIKVENLIIVIVNLIITIIMFLTILKIYMTSILDKFRDVYQTLNEPTNPFMEEFKKSQPKEYMKSIHVAYFCDRVAARLKVPSEGIRCAALYLTMQDKTEFPEEVVQIWQDYAHRNERVINTNALILLTAENVVGTLYAYIEKYGKKQSYEPQLEKIFSIMEEKKICYNSTILYRDWENVKKVFLEERLYYDFLCRE